MVDTTVDSSRERLVVFLQIGMDLRVLYSHQSWPHGICGFSYDYDCSYIRCIMVRLAYHIVMEDLQDLSS